MENSKNNVFSLEKRKKKWEEILSILKEKKQEEQKISKIIETVKKEIYKKSKEIKIKLKDENLKTEIKEKYGKISSEDVETFVNNLKDKYENLQENIESKIELLKQEEEKGEVTLEEEMRNFLKIKIRPRIVFKRRKILFFLIPFVILVVGSFILSIFFLQEWIWDFWHTLGFSLAISLTTLILIITLQNIHVIQKNKIKIQINAVKGKFFDKIFDIEEIKENRIKNGFSSFSLWEGLVRGCVIIILLVVIGFFVGKTYYDLDVPIHLIVVLNLVLVYYGFKPSAVLPQQLIIDTIVPIEDKQKRTVDDEASVSTTKRLINSFPALKKAVNSVETKFSEIVDDISKILEDMGEKYKKFFENIKKKLEELKSDIKTVINNAQDTIINAKDDTDKVKEDIENIIGQIELKAMNFVDKITDKDKNEFNGEMGDFTNKLRVLEKGVNNNIQAISFLSTKMDVKPRHPMELSALLALLVSIGIVNILYISRMDDPLTTFNIIVTLSFSAIAIATGVTVQELIYNIMQKNSKKTFNDTFREVNLFKKETDSFMGKVNMWIDFFTKKSESAIKSIFEPVFDILKQINTSLEKLEVNIIKPIFEEAGKKVDGIIANNPFEKAEGEIKKFQKEIFDKYNKFINRNFLSYLPADVVAFISICGLMSLSIIALLVPGTCVDASQEMGLNHPVFIGIEFIAAYYFTTKK